VVDPGEQALAGDAQDARDDRLVQVPVLLERAAEQRAEEVRASSR
jgi:hypothetical protein